MAYEKPDADQFKERFPEFASTSEDTIDTLLDEADGTAADSSWTEKDYPLALMLYVAHNLAAAATSAANLSFAGIGSVRIGPIGVSFDKGGGSASAEDYSSTPYGLRLMDLTRKNVGGPIVV